MRLKSKFLFVNKIYLTLFSLLALSVIPYQSARCEDLKVESKLCRAVIKISSPTRFLLKHIKKTETLINIVRATGEIQNGQGISKDANATKKRFRKYQPGFEFYFEKGTKPNAGFLLLSRYNPDKKANYESVQLWDINNQEKIHEYFFTKRLSKKLNLKDFKPPMHPIIEENGSLVFHTNGGKLIRLDKCSNLVDSSSGIYPIAVHHSIASDNKGNFYLPTRNNRFKVSKLENKFKNHGFTILDNKFQKQYSMTLLEIYEKNGLLSKIFGMESMPMDTFHLNDVEPFIRSDGKLIVLLSIRNQSTIMALEVESKKIIWLVENVIKRQHDVDIISSKNDMIDITIFDNNIWKTKKIGSDSRGNRVIFLKNLPLYPKDDIIFISTKKQHEKYGLKVINFDWLESNLKPRTITAGLSEIILFNNSLMIEETNFGRLFEIDLKTNKTLWQFINKTKKNAPPFYMKWSRRISKLPGDLNKNSFHSCKIDL